MLPFKKSFYFCSYVDIPRRYLTTLLNSPIHMNNLSIDSFGFSPCSYISSVTNCSFLFSLPSLRFYLFFLVYCSGWDFDYNAKGSDDIKHQGIVSRAVGRFPTFHHEEWCLLSLFCRYSLSDYRALSSIPRMDVESYQMCFLQLYYFFSLFSITVMNYFN